MAYYTTNNTASARIVVVTSDTQSIEFIDYSEQHSSVDSHSVGSNATVKRLIYRQQ